MSSTAADQVTFWQRGFAAYKAGEPMSNCPRLGSANVSAEWRRGYLAARKGDHFDHEYEPGAYGVCRRCGGEAH